jgi:DNA-binding IclR family transcriptional regulator
MITSNQLAEDASTIRGILDLFKEDDIITVRLVAMTQAVNMPTAKRLLDGLESAGILEHPTREADVLGVMQKVPCLGWQLTEVARKGEISTDARKLAGGVA